MVFERGKVITMIRDRKYVTDERDPILCLEDDTGLSSDQWVTTDRFSRRLDLVLVRSPARSFLEAHSPGSLPILCM